MGVIGHMPPLVERFSHKVKHYYSFDRAIDLKGTVEGAEVYPMEREAELLPLCDTVTITGTSMINHTTEEILSMCRNAKHVILSGFSVPFYPEAYRGSGLTALGTLYFTEDSTALICRPLLLAAGRLRVREYTQSVFCRLSDQKTVHIKRKKREEKEWKAQRFRIVWISTAISAAALPWQTTMSRFAMEKLGAKRGDALYCIAEFQNCMTDAVQLVTGCTAGKGNLALRPIGKRAMTLVRRDTGEGFRVTIDFTFPGDGTKEENAMLVLREDAEKICKAVPVKIEVPSKACLIRTVCRLRRGV